MRVRIDHGRLTVTPETEEELDQLAAWTEGVPLFKVLGFSLVSQYFHIDMGQISAEKPPRITLEDTIERRIEQGAGKVEAFHELERIRFRSKRT